MTLTLQLPDRIATMLQQAWDDLPRATLESLAVEGYRTGRLSCAQIELEKGSGDMKKLMHA